MTGVTEVCRRPSPHATTWPERLQELGDECVCRVIARTGTRIQGAWCQKEFGSFDKYIWSFVGGKPIVNKRKSLSEIPPTTKESDALSKDLQKRGFNFVGSTICYAYMQAIGMVNDHTIGCFRRTQVQRL